MMNLLRRFLNRNRHTILAKFKVETPAGFGLFRDYRAFKASLCSVGVFAAADWLGPEPFRFRIWPGETVAVDGYHFCEAIGPKKDHYQWLLLQTSFGDISYHLVTYRNGAKAGT